MKKNALYCMILFCLNVLWCINAEAKIYRVICVRIIDGDTIVVKDIQSHIVRIRLADIDCPESAQPGGAEATNCCRSNLFDNSPKNVCCFIEPKNHDRYGRLVATVYLWDGVNLNRLLVRSGWAFAYYRYSSVYGKDEDMARKLGRGIWGMNPIPMEPWNYRALQGKYDALR